LVISLERFRENNGRADMRIKRLRPDDAALAEQAIIMLKSNIDDAVRRCLSETYLADFLLRDDNILLVALEGTMPIGFALAYSVQRVDRAQNMVLFYEIEVDREHRGKGAGRALISALKKICREKSIMKMWVYTNRSNRAAMNLYASTGGVETRQNDEVMFTYNFGCQETEVSDCG
jgi:ribosomal protein S18 acetylase RimI-like enzyme